MQEAPNKMCFSRAGWRACREHHRPGVTSCQQEAQGRGGLEAGGGEGPMALPPDPSGPLRSAGGRAGPTAMLLSREGVRGPAAPCAAPSHIQP